MGYGKSKQRTKLDVIMRPRTIHPTHPLVVAAREKQKRDGNKCKEGYAAARTARDQRTR